MGRTDIQGVLSFECNYWSFQQEEEPPVYPFCEEEVERVSPYRMEMHRVSYLLFSVMLSGQIHYIVEGKDYILHAGEAMVIPMDSLYMQESFTTGPYVKQVLEIRGSLVKAYAAGLRLDTVRQFGTIASAAVLPDPGGDRKSAGPAVFGHGTCPADRSFPFDDGSVDAPLSGGVVPGILSGTQDAGRGISVEKHGALHQGDRISPRLFLAVSFFESVPGAPRAFAQQFSRKVPEEYADLFDSGRCSGNASSTENVLIPPSCREENTRRTDTNPGCFICFIMYQKCLLKSGVSSLLSSAIFVIINGRTGVFEQKGDRNGSNGLPQIYAD